MARDGPATRPRRGVPGNDVFTLYDTYGFPPELTAEMAREQGFDVDTEGFQREMDAQRERARAAHAFSGAMEILTTYENLGVDRVLFVGYDELHRESVVTALLVDDAPVGHATVGQTVEVVLRDTPFYAEGGGQVGGRGDHQGAQRPRVRRGRPGPGGRAHRAQGAWSPRATCPWETRWPPRWTRRGAWTRPATTAPPTSSTQAFARCWGPTCGRPVPW